MKRDSAIEADHNANESAEDDATLIIMAKTKMRVAQITYTQKRNDDELEGDLKLFRRTEPAPLMKRQSKNSPLPWYERSSSLHMETCRRHVYYFF